MSALGISPRICKPYTPQTKGKVERSIRVVQARLLARRALCGSAGPATAKPPRGVTQLNARVHQTTHERPRVDRVGLERRARPGRYQQGWAWERFTAEERQVSWDGFVSYDGVLYGLPSQPGYPHAGRATRSGDCLARAAAGVPAGPTRPEARRCTAERADGESSRAVCRAVPAAAARRTPVPLGHQVPAPVVAQRPLWEYDQLCGVVGSRGGTREVAS